MDENPALHFTLWRGDQMKKGTLCPLASGIQTPILAFWGGGWCAHFHICPKFWFWHWLYKDFERAQPRRIWDDDDTHRHFWPLHSQCFGRFFFRGRHGTKTLGPIPLKCKKNQPKIHQNPGNCTPFLCDNCQRHVALRRWGCRSTSCFLFEILWHFVEVLKWVAKEVEFHI